MTPIILNSITAKASKNFEKKVAKLLPAGIYEIYLSSCGMKRIGTGSYNFFLDVEINDKERLTLKVHTNSSPAWDEWQNIESGTIKHDNWNKNTALMLLEDQKEWIFELLNPEDYES